MVTRQQAYTAYALAYARQDATAHEEDALTLAAAFGAIDAGMGKTLAGVNDFAARIREAGVLGAEDEDDDPDVGPSLRDQRVAAEERDLLVRIINAGGSVTTGGRSLYESAADEIVRLRGEIDALNDAARRGASRAERAGLWFRAGALDVDADQAEALRGAGFTFTSPHGWLFTGSSVQALRWIAAGLGAARELQQAKEALEQARAKVDELRAEKEPPGAHGVPGATGKETGAAGEEQAPSGKPSVTDEAPQAQGLLRCLR